MSELITKGGNRIAHVPLTFVKALVLDDSEFDRVKIRRLFQTTNLDHTIDEVASIYDFANHIRKDQYDVVLLDFDLPDGTGFEALRILQEVSRDHLFAPLMISGRSCISIKAKAMELGCAAYIPKQDLSFHTFETALYRAIGVSRV